MSKTIKQLKWRYACKKFDASKKLSPKKLNRLKKAFQLTATSFGLFPIKMMVISNPKIKASLLEHAFYQKQVVDCSHLLIICVDKTINAKSIDAHFDLEKKVRGTSEKIIEKFRVNLKTTYSNKLVNEIEQDLKHQAYLALGNLMTVCALEKIDACPMEGFNPQKFDEILKLKDYKSTLLLPVGYRADDDFMQQLKKVRKALNEIIIEM